MLQIFYFATFVLPSLKLPTDVDTLFSYCRRNYKSHTIGVLGFVY